MDTGFNYYHGAEPSEYDLVLSNSEGGIPRLLELGARRAEPLFWAADPELFAPLAVEKEHDVFFYGYGDKFRREWMRELVGEPSRILPELDFALGGRDFRGDIGDARVIGDVPFNVFPRAISVGARQPERHARARTRRCTRSSTCRPFELAACGAAIVSNPHEGIDRWFEPGRELLVVADADEAVAAYRELLADPGAGGGDGPSCARARARRAHVLHTAPAGCSSCSGSACRSWPVPETVELPAPAALPPRLAELRRVAIVPALNEEHTIAGRDRRAARVRRRARRRRRSTTARATAPRASPPRRVRTSCACRSTSASAARCRRASSSRSSTTTTSPSASTATASTIRRSSRALLEPVLARRAPTSSSARASPRTTAGTARRARGASGSGSSPPSSRASSASA